MPVDEILKYDIQMKNVDQYFPESSMQPFLLSSRNAPPQERLLI